MNSVLIFILMIICKFFADTLPQSGIPLPTKNCCFFLSSLCFVPGFVYGTTPKSSSEFN